MSTTDDILSMLRRDALTVTELAERLDVTRNAVIAPLRRLEAADVTGAQVDEQCDRGEKLFCKFVITD